jgi:hypothetical protein
MVKRSEKDRAKDLAEELDVFDAMLSSLVELLEEKGILTEEEYEKRVREKTQRATELTTYREIQFGKKEK